MTTLESLPLFAALSDAEHMSPISPLSPIPATHHASRTTASVARLVEELKHADQDHEFYPTTDAIIGKLACDIGLNYTNEHRNRYKGHSFDSIMDIGAGNGKVLTRLKELCDFNDLFAIEKSSILCRELSEDILVVGTEFNEQSLMSKPVDVVYCNPPYSQFEEWSRRIIRESAAKRVYLCIPQRWKNSVPIADALKFRNASARIIGEFDFEDAEDRTARAKVHLLRVDLLQEADDAFERWFKEQFADVLNKFQPKPHSSPHSGSDQSDDETKSERPFRSLVVGPNYPEALVSLYNEEMAAIQKNYLAVGQLDPDLMREFEILPARIMACLKARMSGLKNDYWMELFSHLDAITNRLTSTSRKALLGVLHKHVQVDFTVSNILEVVIWVIKNANRYIESQLIALYEKMAEKANVVNYKSNQRVFTDNDWRYLQSWGRHEGPPPTHFALDYRIVLQRLGGCRPHYGTVQLDETAAEFMGDLMTVAGNLGFHTVPHERYSIGWSARQDWCPGAKVEFFYEDKKKGRQILFDVRAFQNGNSHFRLKQEFMLALNVEHGRLKGWLRTPAEAAEELKDPEAATYFKSNLQLLSDNPTLLLAA
jgi:hypothetical protein